MVIPKVSMSLGEKITGCFLPRRPLLLAYIFACKMGTWGSGPGAGMASPVWACRDEGCGLPLTWRSPDAAEVKPQAQEEVRLRDTA